MDSISWDVSCTTFSRICFILFSFLITGFGQAGIRDSMGHTTNDEMKYMNLSLSLSLSRVYDMMIAAG